jgi:hypothetical protein
VISAMASTKKESIYSYACRSKKKVVVPRVSKHSICGEIHHTENQPMEDWGVRWLGSQQKKKRQRRAIHQPRAPALGIRRILRNHKAPTAHEQLA